jgi:hypothetical protein
LPRWAAWPQWSRDSASWDEHTSTNWRQRRPETSLVSMHERRGNRWLGMSPGRADAYPGLLRVRIPRLRNFPVTHLVLALVYPSDREKRRCRPPRLPGLPGGLEAIYVCHECGERYYDAYVARHMRQLAKKGMRAKRRISLPLIRFEESEVSA